MARCEASHQAIYMQAEVLRSNRMSTVLGSSLELGTSSTENPWSVHIWMGYIRCRNALLGELQEQRKVREIIQHLPHFAPPS